VRQPGGFPVKGKTMWEFLRAFWGDFVATMSGIVSVLLWITSALLEGSNVPLSVRLTFIVAAACCMVLASFRVWKEATDKGAARLAAREAEWKGAQEAWAAERAQLQDQISRTAMGRDVAQKLSDFHREAGALRTQIANSDDATSVEEWEKKIGAWVSCVSGYLTANVSPAQGQYFGGHVSYFAASIPGLKSKVTREGKNNLILMLEARLKRLEEAMTKL
jgi:hypothetical protein